MEALKWVGYVLASILVLAVIFGGGLFITILVVVGGLIFCFVLLVAFMASFISSYAEDEEPPSGQ